MAISLRRLRFRLRFGFGLAALVAVMLLVPAAYAQPKAGPAPPTTPAADQYKPTIVSYVTIGAARIGKCKLAVVRLYAPKKKRCKTKACRLTTAKAELAAKRRCDRIGQAVRTHPAVKPKPTPKPVAKKH
jgi:hypothetical protein